MACIQWFGNKYQNNQQWVFCPLCGSTWGVLMRKCNLLWRIICVKWSPFQRQRAQLVPRRSRKNLKRIGRRRRFRRPDRRVKRRFVGIYLPGHSNPQVPIDRQRTVWSHNNECARLALGILALDYLWRTFAELQSDFFLSRQMSF